MMSNPFKKQSGGKLSVTSFITLAAAVALAAVFADRALMRTHVTPAPYGYLALDLAYVNGKVVHAFPVAANVDKDTCVQDGKRVAEELLASPEAPDGVSIVVDCIPMPPTPAASSAPDAPRTLQPHDGEQGDPENSKVI